MDPNLSLNHFLSRNNISQETWDNAKIEWKTLQAIASDHDAQAHLLENSAEMFAKVIQKFDGVHSVRWRVKSSEHLINKIVRKRADGHSKYVDIGLNNYYDLITDLVGVRALHLFKRDCFTIDTAIRSNWALIETPVAYIRDGDSETLQARFHAHGFEVKNHPAGYRSVHYVFTSKPLNRTIVAEIQVRTIFEEGWSEIDHTVRYPNFHDNPLIEYFLEIFNRMAGSADDMGGFVLGLVDTLSELDKKILEAKQEKEETLQQMEQALQQLEKAKEQDSAYKESIAALKQEIEKLRKVDPHPVGLNMNNVLGAQITQTLEAIRASQASQAAAGQKMAEGLRRSIANVGSLNLNNIRRTGNPSEQARRGLLRQNEPGLLGLPIETKE